MNTKDFIITLNNVPKDLSKYRYVIGRFVEGEFWYYGADNNYDRCVEIADEIGNGFVVENK